MSDDRGLERGILAGSAAYGSERVFIRHRPTPTATVNGRLQRVGNAGCDFPGALSGGNPFDAVVQSARALVIEAKAVAGTALPIERFTQAQLDELAAIHAMGGLSLIVAAFDFRFGETFAIHWPTVAAFFARPWSKSLSIAHARAVGLCVSDLAQSYPEPRLVMFLDGTPHPLRARALEELEHEKAAARPRRAARVQESALPPASADEVRRRASAATTAGEKNARRRA